MRGNFIFQDMTTELKNHLTCHSSSTALTTRAIIELSTIIFLVIKIINEREIKREKVQMKPTESDSEVVNTAATVSMILLIG